MTYLIRFEGSFATKKEAIAFANLIEGIKTKFVVEERETYKPEFQIGRSLKVWESTHDEATPLPCVQLVNVDFNSVEVERDIDGVVPSPELVMSEKTMGDVTTKVLAMGAVVKEEV
jgi:hypothetical protein